MTVHGGPSFLAWQMSRPKIRENPRWQENVQRHLFVEMTAKFLVLQRQIAAAITPAIKRLGEQISALNRAFADAGASRPPTPAQRREWRQR